MAIRTEEMMLNIGPQHPSTHGVFRIMVKIDGEIVNEAIPVVGYLHRGTEKIAEDLTYAQVNPYFDRLDYLNAMTNNYAWCYTVEKLMGIETPERAEYLRVINMELNRVASHLVWWGTFLLDIGALSPFIYAFRDREYILDLFNKICGARLTYTYMRIGGVRFDAPPGWIDEVKETVKLLRENIKEYDTLVTGNEVFQHRTMGVGVITKEQAIDWGLTGPVARASGVDFDIRRDDPYSIYDRFDYDIPVRTKGDVYAKYEVRLEEIRQSLNIVEQACEQIEKIDGPVLAKVPKIIKPPKGEIYCRVEGSKGELGVHLISDGTTKPYRMKTRRPSFVNVSILPELLKGENIANLVAIFGGLDVVLGEVDA
ncbi:NADH-quinone oxidoreductase subunit D [Desulfuribacillus alkaliarsenatis]|uniref:NADH-quinone oxidoreductase subunit D n=1 Tax=Desulfuribacillus alkaliarsenatis TaxID=766136 RepID=A0A1E5G1P0_9FIRM|nr:NADH-quinone oxidoreductase subunit D [Desulfuribacillus alkaliarsenatis]OEF96783.1 NADH dehydrogenase [Desulfuribacillus alkaliarsenatis]